MQLQINIGFDDLLKVVKELPHAKLLRLRAEIDKKTKQGHDKSDLEQLLLNGPTFTDKQLETIAQTRKSINQWRAK